MRKKRKISRGKYKKDVDNRDKGGSTRITAFDFKKAAGRKFWKPKEGTNKINIIPFEIKSKQHPEVASGDMEIGELDYVMDVWAHQYVGPDKVDLLCPKKTYGKHCPLCDEVSKLYDEDNKDAAKDLQASRRVLFNVQPIVRGEPGELMLFEVSHFKFMKELLDEANACTDGDDIIDFADIEEGKVIKFRAVPGDFKNSLDFKSFDFLDREEELSEDLIDEAISLDELLIVRSPAEMESLYYGNESDDEDDEEEQPPKRKKASRQRKEEDEPDEEEDEPDEEESLKEKINKAKKSPDEEKKTDSKCPAGHVFGEDCDNHKECRKCDIWDECDDASTL